MTISYPFLPDGRTILYVSEDNPFMQEAKKYALARSLDRAHPTGSVVVKGARVLGHGVNGSDYHEKYGCERKRQGIPTGEKYELCEGCHPRNHSEPRAIADALTHGEDLNGADLYLFGHWWCCKPCWDAMNKVGIKDVYLLQGSEKLFNITHQENIIKIK